jgi:CheY-like chemotaxis protein
MTVSVKDTGIGIQPEALPRLFQMFSQVDSAITRSDGGLGIGLALVKGLVMLHGGTVEARSAGLGLGSEFIIHLPQSVIIQSVASSSDAETRGDAEPGKPSKLKVLVADDNVDAAESLALLLEMNGHEVCVARNGQQALQLASSSRPHVMILDIGMPDITGYEVARRVRLETWGRDVILIAATGWGQEEDKAQATAAGFDYHLTKPVDPDRLENLLHAFSHGA